MRKNPYVIEPEEKRRAERPEGYRDSLPPDGTRPPGLDSVSTGLRRLTVRSVKFVRWLRHFIYRAVPWREALARLRLVYSTL